MFLKYKNPQFPIADVGAINFSVVEVIADKSGKVVVCMLA